MGVNEMSSVIQEKWIGDIRWLIASGEREEVFLALGNHARQEISSVVSGLPELAALRTSVSNGQLAEAFRATVEASRVGFPVEFGELEALAEGSGVDIDDLLLLTLRGDLEGHDDLGCSDFGWTNGERALLGHNEDGHFRLDGACSLLTLRIDGEPAVVTWWYPGFLPGNTYSINEYGLVWGVDTIHMARAQMAPGRSFVARALQRVTTLDGIVPFLKNHPTAGAFAYVAGQFGSARLLTVEQAGDQVAIRESPQDPGCIWHTNHLCDLPDSLNRASTDSLARGAVLSLISATHERPSVSWLLEVLTGATPPFGVRAEGTDVTLCTFAADFEERTITLLQRGSYAVTLSAEELLRGESELARDLAVAVEVNNYRDQPGENE
jgi:hypothetical protein